MGLDRPAVDPAKCCCNGQARSKTLPRDAGSGGNLHAAADGPQRLDRINNGRGSKRGWRWRRNRLISKDGILLPYQNIKNGRLTVHDYSCTLLTVYTNIER